MTNGEVKQYIFKCVDFVLDKSSDGEGWARHTAVWRDKYGHDSELPFFVGGYTRGPDVRLGAIYRCEIKVDPKWGKQVVIINRVSLFNDPSEIPLVLDEETAGDPFSDPMIDRKYYTTKDIAEAMNTARNQSIVAQTIIKAAADLLSGTGSTADQIKEVITFFHNQYLELTQGKAKG